MTLRFVSHLTLMFHFLTVWAAAASSATLNGFALDGATIDEELMQRGGPPRDGIPALDHPAFIPAEKAGYLGDDDRVLGVVLGGVAKAYPIAILNWHEVVNDLIDETPLLISYCPLCGTGMVFSRRVAGEVLDFGVSGLLYNSDVLMYDRQSESLWSQLLGQAVTGRHAGATLTHLAARHTSWKRWRHRYPDTLVLSRDTGYLRDYGSNPYDGYSASDRLFFPVQHRAEGDMDLKETVLGVAIGGRHKAYPFSRLKESGKRAIRDSLAGVGYTVYWDEEGFSARIVDEEGIELPSVQAFWFAWYAFHPETEIFNFPGEE